MIIGFEIPYESIPNGEMSLIYNDEIFKKIIETSKKLNINFILATPPCQGMSLLGKQESEDPRNLLITRVVKAIEEKFGVSAAAVAVAGGAGAGAAADAGAGRAAPRPPR